MAFAGGAHWAISRCSTTRRDTLHRRVPQPKISSEQGHSPAWICSCSILATDHSSERKCGLWGRPSQNLLLGTSLHPLLGNTGDCWLLLLAEDLQFSDEPLHGTVVMCCQSLGLCFRRCGKSITSWLSKVWYLRSVHVLQWRVGSWQRLANICRSSSEVLLHLFYLFKNWWAGASLVGFRMSGQETYVTSHLDWGFCLCCLSGARTLNLGRRLLPYHCYDSEGNVSQVKALPPLRSGWPETQIQIQRIVRRCNDVIQKLLVNPAKFGP
jgi:hypothetical protein